MRPLVRYRLEQFWAETDLSRPKLTKNNWAQPVLGHNPIRPLAQNIPEPSAQAVEQHRTKGP